MPGIQRADLKRDPVFPAAPGDYVLWLALDRPFRLSIGRLGAFDFPAGRYAYVGSARGPGGLSGRLKHHLAPVARPHWHADYLRAAATLEDVWWLAGDQPLEHRWAAALAELPGAEMPAPRFGASDCCCPSHLYRFEEMPALDAFARLTGAEIE